LGAIIFVITTSRLREFKHEPTPESLTCNINHLCIPVQGPNKVSHVDNNGRDGQPCRRPSRSFNGTPSRCRVYVQLQELLKREWLTYPAMLMEGGSHNYCTINGKAYPSTETIHLRVGQTVKLRTNNNFVHPMHVHGGPFQVVAVDGSVSPIRSMWAQKRACRFQLDKRATPALPRPRRREPLSAT
jgi:hypothetical protein